MKKLNLLLLMLLLSMTFYSCKDDGEDDVNPVQTPDEFSELTDEQNKKNLEDNGIAMVNEMETLKDVSAIKTSIAFSSFLETSKPTNENGRVSSAYYSLTRVLNLFGKDKSSAKAIFKSMRTEADGEPETLQTLFDDAVGTYSWNNGVQAWDYEAGGNMIVFKFPSTESGTANNAIYTIHSYTGTTPSDNPFDADYTGDLPTGLAVDLTVDGTTVLEYGYAATFNANGEPTAFETTLSLVPFTFKVTLTNDSKEVSVKYSLTNNGRILWDMGIGAKGNFTTDNIENSGAVGDALTSGFAYFQLLNIKLAGEVNVKAISDDRETIYANDEAEGFDEDAATDKFVVSLNTNVNLVLFYVEDNTKIADTEFYATEETDYRCEYQYDPETGSDSYECGDYTYKEENIRLVFSDDSKSDLDTYTEGSFEALQSELEALLDDVETEMN